MLFLPVFRFRNDPKENCDVAEQVQKAQYLNNGHFHLSAGHHMARAALQLVNKTYNVTLNHRGQSGPRMMAKAFLDLYQLGSIRNTDIESDDGQSKNTSSQQFPKNKQTLDTETISCKFWSILLVIWTVEQKCTGSVTERRQLRILPDFSFMPVHWRHVKSVLWSKKDRSSQFWDELFQCSYAVHFFSCASKNLPVSGHAHKDAYSYLGPTHCPLSFNLSSTF